MGVNLGNAMNDLGQLFGLGGQQPQAQMGPRALLGPVAIDPDAGMAAPLGVQQQAPQPQPPQEEVTPDIQVGRSIPRMGPEAMGMPGMPAMRSADPNQITDIRQALKEKAEMARQIYHPKSEFGTSGLLRDIIGNASDFGRRLLGFSPRYNEEKWTERAYGMTSTDPAVRAAAREQAMQYNPKLTQDYQQHITQDDVQTTNAAVNRDYKTATAQGRSAQILSGLGQNLLASTLGAEPAQTEALYQRFRPAIQKQLDTVYGPGVVEAPEQADEAFIRGLSQAGYTGTNVAGERKAVLNAQTQRELGKLRAETQVRVQQMRGATQIEAARILADTRMSLAEKEQALKMLPVEETQITEESGSIIRPTTTRTVTKGYAPGGQGPSSQPQNIPAGTRRRSRSTGKIETWDGRNWN